MLKINDLQIIERIKQSFISLNYLTNDNRNEQKLYTEEKNDSTDSLN